MYDKNMAREIVAYLRENPYAGDSVEGISRWWLMRHRITESIEEVEKVLKDLRDKGCLYECSLANSRKVYFAAPEQAALPGDGNNVE